MKQKSFKKDGGVFANESTPSLLRKYLMGRTMSSNFFINNSLKMMNMSYKIIGVKATNFFIDKTYGAVYTSGSNIETLLKDIAEHEQKNIHALVGYVVEGLDQMDENKV